MGSKNHTVKVNQKNVIISKTFIEMLIHSTDSAKIFHLVFEWLWLSLGFKGQTQWGYHRGKRAITKVFCNLKMAIS